MFGDILSDEASELSGSLGLGGSINAGDDVCVAQAQHGSAPDIAGKDRRQPDLADPVGGDAARLAGPARRASRRFRRRRRYIEAAVDKVLNDPATAHRGPRRDPGHAGFRQGGRRDAGLVRPAP